MSGQKLELRHKFDRPEGRCSFSYDLGNFRGAGAQRSGGIPSGGARSSISPMLARTGAEGL